MGSADTRAQIIEIAGVLKRRGWTIIFGGGERSEEYLPPLGGGRKGSNFIDITAVKGHRVLRINTTDTLSDGVTPTLREAAAAALIRKKMPADHLLLTPKERGR